MWFHGLVDRPEDDRFVGQARVPLPVTAVPYTEPLYLHQRPPRKRRGGLFYAGLLTVMLLICAFGVLIGLTFGHDVFSGSPFAAAPPSPTPSPTPPRPTPKAVAEKFLSATISGDQRTAQDNLCELLRGEGGNTNSDSNQEWLKLFVDYQVGDESIQGPSASVNVKLTLPIVGEVPFDFYLIQEQGAWRICGIGPS